MTLPSGLWFIDGIDVTAAFNLLILKGATQFLELPPKKESISHDWLDSDGIDTDLTFIYYAHREIALQCAIVAPDEATFIIKRDLLLNQFRQPGLRRFSFKSTGQRSFYAYYKNSTGWQAVEPLKGSPAEGQIMYTFTIVVVETNPSQGGTQDVFIVDEEGRFLIT